MIRIILIFCPLFLFLNCYTQTTELVLSLENVIQLAHDQSPESLLAKHRFRASYWEYRTYVASRRPLLSIDGTIPDLNRSIEKITLNDGTDKFVDRKVMNTLASASLTQNIGLTGGSVFINSDLQRIDQLGSGSTYSYLSTPVSIGFRQPLFSYNNLGWAKKISPLKYEEAKRNYVSSMERVSIRAIELFFDLALAQINLEIAHTNYNNTDTLYKIARGRYNIGTIAENELLQMELSFLNAGTELNESRVDMELRRARLRSFLGYNETVNIRLLYPESIPQLTLEFNRTLEEAMKNNPEILSMQRQLLEAERDVARARSERGYNTTLFASYGLTQRADEFQDVYNNPQDQQRFRIGLEVPILDWGLGKGKVEMAKSTQEVVKTQIQQDETDFQQNVYLQVMQFNLQDDQLLIAAKADTIAKSRYEVTKQRFLIGKIDVLDLNVALTEKDQARRRYIEALRNYWSFLYQIRQLTLFDFLKGTPIEVPAEFPE